MSKNYMVDIAEMLGIELGEKFILLSPNGDNPKGEYVITSNGLKRTESGLYDCTDTLMCMLLGCYEIKKPWKPKEGDTYHFPNIWFGIPLTEEDEWEGDTRDRKRYEANMVCKTTDEALKKAEKMLAALRE